ncbi:MAG TPA: serine/threonine protein kinase [Phycisphaerales bacterium]|nr:serine/threonine protein kinase [Phycisphaerales bacterium]
MQPPEVGPGSQLENGYQLERVLGQGGMGTVYLAHSPEGEARAVKALKLECIEDDSRAQAIQQFEEEARLLTGLKHPGLVQIFGHYHEAGNHFLLMEYIRGSTVTQWLKQSDAHLPLDDALSVIEQLCAVLHYLHTQDPPIIFRDLKPSNIMVNDDLKVKLIDFGIARHFSDETRTQTFIKGLGSAGYAPLEQYGAGTTDPRSDIYALGATFYTLLTKRTPPPVVAVVAGIDQVKSISSINPDVPPRIEAIIGRMMAIRKEQRFDSIEQLRTYLFDSASEEDDPTGTLSLARERAQKAELGPCLVCKRIGDEAGPYHPPHTPLSQSEVDLSLPATLVLGLKSEADPQSGLHFQKGDKKKHASSQIDLGFEGAAALVLAPSQGATIDGQTLLTRIRNEFINMAFHLLENLEVLEPQFRISALPILQQLIEKCPHRRTEILRACYQCCEEALGKDSAVLNLHRTRLALALLEAGEPERASQLLAESFSWYLQEAETRTRQGRHADAGKTRGQALDCWLKGHLGPEALFSLLDPWSQCQEKLGQKPAQPFQNAILTARKFKDSRLIAEAQLALAHYLHQRRDLETAQKEVEEALHLAETVYCKEDGALYPYVQLTAEIYETLRLPEKLEMKSRALILKYKAKR